MATRKIVLPSPNTVAASATSLITLPVGTNYRYQAVHLQIGCVSGGTAIAATDLPTGSSTTAGYINDIRVKVNGKVQRLHTCDQLVKMNAINGSVYAVATYGSRTANKEYGQIITIWFYEPWRKSLGQADALSLCSWLANSVEVEVDFGALPSNGATSGFRLRAWADVDTINDMSDVAKNTQKNGLVMAKVFRQNVTGGTAAGSAVDVTWLDRRDLYTAVYADLGNTARAGTAANGITVATIAAYTAKLKITANAVDVHDIPKDVAANAIQYRGMNPGQFDLEAVLDCSDDMASGLPAGNLSDFRVRITNEADTAASATWTLLTERTGPID